MATIGMSVSISTLTLVMCGVFSLFEMLWMLAAQRLLQHRLRRDPKVPQKNKAHMGSRGPAEKEGLGFRV